MNARPLARTARSLAFALTLAGAGTAQANIYTWQDHAGGNAYSWLYDGNWAGGTLPTSSATTELVFGADVDGRTNNDIGPFTMKNLTLQNRDWTMTGGSLRFAAGGRLAASGGTSSIANDLILEGGFEMANASSLTLTGEIGGGLGNLGSLTKTGAGPLTLSGRNGYGGGTTLAEGTVRTFSDTALGSGNLTMIGGNLEVAEGRLELQNILFGNGAVWSFGSISGAGQILLRGDIRMNVPSAFNASARISTDILLDSGQHTISSDSYFASSPRNDMVLSGVISGPGGLTLAAETPSTCGIVLTQQNRYSGPTIVNGGILVVGTTNALPKNTALTVKDGGTLSLLRSPDSGFDGASGSFDQTIGSLSGDGSINLSSATLTVGDRTNTTFSGRIVGSGAMVKEGPGTLALTGELAYDGGTSINGGKLIVARPYGDYASRHATLEMGNEDARTLAGAVTGVGAFVKSGTGTLTLTGSIADTMTRMITAGTLKGTADKIVGNYTGSAGGTLEVGTTAPSFLNVAYSGAGDFRKSGTGALLVNAPLGNTGTLSVAEGALVSFGTGTFGSRLSVARGAQFANFSGGTQSFAKGANVQGEVVTVYGAKTTFDDVVSGAGAFTGLGEVEFNGGYQPGNSPAAVEFQGDLRLSARNELVMELGGTVLGTGYDHLDVSGTAFLGGALRVATYGGFSAEAGQTFDLFDGTLSGTFASISLPTLSNGYEWNTIALYTDGTISVQAVPEPATLAILGIGALGLLRRRKRA
ncbi:PEP-CTERM sorting domain-containing protein [bacterium]|nr:MAG: PEP-CTERM sorting domain-containing protein [bacterium]